jgi:serine/threonine protein kinase
MQPDKADPETPQEVVLYFMHLFLVRVSPFFSMPSSIHISRLVTVAGAGVLPLSRNRALRRQESQYVVARPAQVWHPDRLWLRQGLPHTLGTSQSNNLNTDCMLLGPERVGQLTLLIGAQVIRESFDGTRGYMPPERANSAAGDMWSAGVLLCKMVPPPCSSFLTGRSHLTTTVSCTKVTGSAGCRTPPTRAEVPGKDRRFSLLSLG